MDAAGSPVDLGLGNETTATLAEIALALVLFGDASRIDLRVLRRQAALPARLLLIGLPLTIVAGGLVAWGVFDGLGLVDAALISAVLVAPVFAVLLAVVAQGVGGSAAVAADDRVSWATFAAQQVGLGALVGIAVGLLAMLVVAYAAQRGWTSPAASRLAVLALAMLAWAAAGAVGAMASSPRSSVD